MEEINKIVQEETENLIGKTGIDASVRVEEEDGSYKVQIDTDENALLIGKHGNTLSSLELILSLIVAKKTGEFRRVTVEVGGYRQEREQYLRDLAERLKEEVIETGSDKTIRGLKPWERRIIHIHLGENEDVLTGSEGEERDRVLVIKKK